MRLPHFDIRLIFERTIAGERGSVIGKFDHYVAGAALPFHAFEPARAHHELAAVFLEDRGVGRGIGLVALFVIHVDSRDPVTLGHERLPDGSASYVYFAADAISSTTACAAALGSAAATTGRPTTR